MVAGPMTGAWEAMTAAEVNQHRSLKYLPASGWDQYVRDRNNGGRPLTTMGGAQREAFTAGAQWAKRTQALWDTLPTDEAIWELRAGRTSIFYPLFAEDPAVWANCARCHDRVVITAQGVCPACQHDFIED